VNGAYYFTKRNLTEISRDILSYIFCMAFPVVMLVIMTLVNETIPAESGMTIFRIDNLTGGVLIFGQTFLMLFTALNVSKDRSGSFLIRLFASPMKSRDFIEGYIIPMLIVGAAQAVLVDISALIISIIVGYDLSIAGLLAALPVLFLTGLFFISIGLIFGSLFNQNAAPGLCSIIISLGSFIGGIWFDAESAGGTLLKICKCMPFLYCTKTVRSAIKTDFISDNFPLNLAVVFGSALVMIFLAVAVFKSKMRADLK